VLIAAKADLTSALHLAVIVSGSASTCRLLIDEGASLTAVDDKGRTPLEVAKSQGKAECVAILEAAGAVLPPAVAAAYAFVDEQIATTRGFRFPVIKAADEEAPSGMDELIYVASKNGEIDELLGLCKEWAGHAVIDAHGSDAWVSQYINTKTNTITCIRLLTY